MKAPVLAGPEDFLCSKPAFAGFAKGVFLVGFYFGTVGLGRTKNIYFVIYVSIGIFLKRVAESSLPSNYECLTPNIDQVVPV